MFRRSTSQAILGLALLLPGATALAGSFGVSPIRVTLTLQQPAGMLTVRNRSDAETVVQLDAHTWSQQDGAELLEKTADLIAVPPLFTLAPGGAQIVRIGLRRPPSAAGERTYRLLLREVPPPPADDFSGLQVALNLSLPVFVLPAAGAVPDLHWDLGVSGSGVAELRLRNDGDAHAQLRTVRLAGPAGELIEGQNLPVYLLPGQGRAWPLDTNAAAGSRWTLTADTDAGPLETELVFESN